MPASLIASVFMDFLYIMILLANAKDQPKKAPAQVFTALFHMRTHSYDKPLKEKLFETDVKTVSMSLMAKWHLNRPTIGDAITGNARRKAGQTPKSLLAKTQRLGSKETQLAEKRDQQEA